MPKQIIEYRVFVASPGDVQEERSILEEVVKELNLTVNKERGIKLELLKWETHTYPAFGIDGQDVINKQIEEDYDIFIGIMHGRFGTPTKRAESGTYEEFELAYKRWQKKASSISIMFYFKTAPIDIYKCDLEQLNRVRKFHDEVIEKGGLLRKFETVTQFGQLLRVHLSNLLADIHKSNNQVNLTINDVSAYVSQVESEINEVGLYESLEIGEQKLLEAIEPLNQLTSFLNELTNKMNEKTKLLKRLSGVSNETRQRETRRLVDLLADDYSIYCRRVQTELPIYKEKFSGAMKFLTNAHSIYINWLQQKETTLILACEDLKKSIEGTMESTNNFKEELKAVPGLTTKMIKSKKEILRTQENIESELIFSIQLLEEILNQK